MPEFSAEPELAAEPEPVLQTEQQHASDVVVEPQPLPDFVVDSRKDPAPVAKTPLQPVSALDPEPDPGPLPDYVVDPARPRERIQKKPLPRPAPLLGVDAEQSVDPDPAVPSLAGLGLPPLAHFPSLVKESGQDDAEPDTERAPKERRPRPAPISSRKGRRERSAKDPGDEPEAISWMDGLSTRLSAYSLADEGSSSSGSQDGKPEPEGTEDEEVV